MLKYFLENRISAYMLFAGLALFGVIGLTRLPLSLMPRLDHPALSVIIEYPGISPDKIETIITRPSELALRSVPGIESIRSVSEEGKSRINVAFHLDTDIRLASLKVREKLALIRDSFPRAVQEPLVVRYDPSDRPVIIASVERIPISGASAVRIREYAERVIKPRLQRIEGVSEIIVAGGLRREIHVDIDSGRFAARGLDFNSLFAALQGGNIAMPGGIVKSGGRDHFLYTPERFRTLERIAETSLYHDDSGRSIRLDEVARVSDSWREREDIARLDGRERVLIYIHRAGDANVLEVCSAVQSTFNALTESEIRMVYNQGEYIESAISNVVRSGLWGLLTVLLTVYLFYGDPLRSLVIGLCIPLSVITVFACMYFAGIPIDVMSLSGLALSAGMVVDNGIIVSESLREDALTPGTALAGVRRVKNAVMASTATTIAVFFPIVFGDTITRRMYSGLAFTVTAALLVSLAVALILLPALRIDLAGRFTKAGNTFRGYPGLIGRFLPGALRIAAIRNFLEEIPARYGKALDRAFSDRRKLFAGAGAILLLSTACLFFIKTEFMDPFGGGEFYVYCEFPTGTTLEATDRAVKHAEERIEKMEVADKLSSKTEKWRGTIAVTLKDAFSSPGIRAGVKKRIGDDLNAILAPHGAFAFISEADESAAREMSLVFTGDDGPTLRKLAREAAGKIRALPGIEECVLRFREGRPAFRMTVDRNRAALSGVSHSDLAGFFHNALFGPVITKFLDTDREIDVRVKFTGSRERTMEDILGFIIPSSTGGAIPARELLSVEEGLDETKLWRHNGRRSVSITARPGALTSGEAAEQITEAMKGVTLPPEYGWEFDESLASGQKTRRAMLALTGLAILLVFMIIAGLLESLRLPLLIILTVPMAFMGVAIALALTGTTLSAAASIGLIVLTGITVNHGIVLVDRMNESLEAHPPGGIGELEARVKAISLEHFRPLMVTAVTTIAGFLPALIAGGDGSGLWRPLALTVISGLSCSTALTMFVLPVLFSRFYLVGNFVLIQKQG